MKQDLSLFRWPQFPSSTIAKGLGSLKAWETADYSDLGALPVRFDMQGSAIRAEDARACPRYLLLKRGQHEASLTFQLGCHARTFHRAPSVIPSR